MAGGFTHESTKNESQEWYTPARIFEALGLTFDLDPCHPEGDPLPWVPAAKVYTKADDGLAQDWAGLVWMNPPYGPETERWMAKLAEHRCGIALVFARTDTRWFHDYVTEADAICFVKGRIRFVDREGREGGSPGAGSMLVAWGEECVEALIQSNLGHVMKAWWD